jgi:protein gp37
MNKTGIEWCDYTWNPIVGCSPASAGCDNCYAAAISKRFHLPWGSAHFMPERLEQPANVKKPGRVFVCSMADLFHETGTAGMRAAVFDAMRAAPWHTYIVLTKRPWNITPGMNWPRNWWLGVTAENQSTAEERIPILISTPAAVRFVSVEPMLSPVTLRRVRFPTGCLEDVLSGEVSERAKPIVGKLNTIDWVIAGPETGPKARPCEASWIDALAAESPCFFDKRATFTRREFPKGETDR